MYSTSFRDIASSYTTIPEITKNLTNKVDAHNRDKHRDKHYHNGSIRLFLFPGFFFTLYLSCAVKQYCK